MSEILEEIVETTEENKATIEKAYYYAEINEDNVCVGIASSTTEPDKAPTNWVEIPNYDASYITKIYIDGVWEEPEPMPEPVPEPTQLDRIEEAVNSIASGQNENTEAIDALLGV